MFLKILIAVLLVGSAWSAWLKPSRRIVGQLLLHTKSSETNNDSLSHLVSSPERYAAQLNITLAELQAAQGNRRLAARGLQLNLQRHPNDASQLVAEYHYQYGKHPFVCSTCWTFQPICVCASLEQKLKDIPIDQIIVWTHHKEWGSPSNTGALLPLLLPHTKLWMRGYHDNEMKQLLERTDIQPVILWPNHAKEENNSQTGSEYWLWSKEEDKHQLDDIEPKQEWVLIALEGTWRQARRLLNQFPTNIPRLSVAPAASSRLAPLRRQRQETLCTAEAVVAACRALQENECKNNEEWNSVLDAVELKVQLTRRYQGRVLREP